MTAATDRLLANARTRISQVDPATAAELRDAGAQFIDTRPVAQRVEFGEIPGAVVIERNVLEWRLDPLGEHRLAAIDHSRPIIVFCQEGYASTLAVASLVDVGVTDVHDLLGGFDAWSESGFPTTTQQSSGNETPRPP